MQFTSIKPVAPGKIPSSEGKRCQYSVRIPDFYPAICYLSSLLFSARRSADNSSNQIMFAAGQLQQTLRSATVNHERRCLQSSVFLPCGSRWHGTDAFILEKPTSGYNWFSLLLSSRDSLSQMKLDEREKKDTGTHAHT